MTEPGCRPSPGISAQRSHPVLGGPPGRPLWAQSSTLSNGKCCEESTAGVYFRRHMEIVFLEGHGFPNLELAVPDSFRGALQGVFQRHFPEGTHCQAVVSWGEHPSGRLEIRVTLKIRAARKASLEPKPPLWTSLSVLFYFIILFLAA